MRTIITALCVFALSAAAADRTLNIRNAASPQAHQELATALRSILELPSAGVDSVRHTVTLSGSESQLNTAAWLLTELDKPAPPPGDKPQSSGIQTVDDESLQVFTLASGRTVQQLQEAATALRSIVEIRRLFAYSQASAIAVRGTPVQLKAAEWIWRTLETDQPSPGAEAFRAALPDGQQVLRAYRMPVAWSDQELQEAATLMRAIVELRRLFTCSRTRTIITRGDDNSIAAASWLAAEIKRPASADLAESEPFHMTEDLARVFRLPAARFDPAALHRLAADVRQQTQLRRAFILPAPRIIALRGTASQVAQAESIITAAK